MRNGFTILEGIISMVLLGIILAGVAPMFYFGRRTSARSAIRRQAVQVAAREMEACLTSGYAQIQNGENTVVVGGRTFTVQITVEEYSNGVPPDSLKQVTTEVEWSFGNSTEAIDLTTLISSVGHGS